LGIGAFLILQFVNKLLILEKALHGLALTTTFVSH
jgi:hypothetical protein